MLLELMLPNYHPHPLKCHSCPGLLISEKAQPTRELPIHAVKKPQWLELHTLFSLFEIRTISTSTIITHALFIDDL